MLDPLVIYKKLYSHFGPQDWWPGNSRFEVIVGAILTQQVSWSNVEVAIRNLKKAGMLDPEKLAVSDIRAIEELIRPSGFFRQKAGYLQAFCRHLADMYGHDLDSMFRKDAGELRRELLELKGIGPETADSILLYAGGKPTFVIDAYTLRICGRSGFFGNNKLAYEDAKRFFESGLPADAGLFNEFHALFVALGKKYCKAGNPKCDGCPLDDICEFADSHGQ